MTASRSRRLPMVAIPHGVAAAASVREILSASRDLCEPALFFDRTTAERATAVVAVASRLAEVFVVDDANMVQAMVDRRPDGVVTFEDRLLETADEARRVLALPGAVGSVNPWDKLHQRTTFRGAGLSRLLAEPIDTPEEFLEAVRRVGLPGVLKPRRGVSGASLRFVLDEGDVDRELVRRPDWKNCLYEQFIPRSKHPSGVAWLGDHVSVESVSSGEGHQHVAIFDKTPVNVSVADDAGDDQKVRETGDVHPSRLPTSVREQVLAMTNAALEALQVRWRVTHTELRVATDLVEVIEVNGRAGGDVTALLSRAAGADLVRASLETALGRTCDVVAVPRSAVAHLDPSFAVRHGTVRSRVSRAELLDLPGVIAVGFFARHGDDRAVTGHRAADLSLEAATFDELASCVRQTLEQLGRLFAPDGLARDEWMRDMLGRLGDPGQQTSG